MRFFQSLILALAVLVCIASGCKSNLTAEATAQIVFVQYDIDEDPDTEISFKFTANGREYFLRAEKQGDWRSTFQVGKPAVVCYNPSNPQQSDIFAAGHKCGK